MTEEELFKEWWETEGNFGEEQPQHIRQWIYKIAEIAWKARSNLKHENVVKECTF